MPNSKAQGSSSEDGSSSSSGDGGAAEAVGALIEQAGASAAHVLHEPHMAVTKIASQLKEMLESDVGRKAAAQLQQETLAPLLIPGQVLEGVLFDGLRSTLRNSVQTNALTYVRFFGLRVVVACGVFHLVKQGARRLAKRHGNKTCQKVVDFVTEVTLPTGFFGPVLGITTGILQLTGTLPKSAIPTMADSSEGSSDSPVAASTSGPPSGAQATAAIISTIIGEAAAGAAALPGQGIVGIPSDHPAAAVGALVGLPVAPASGGSSTE